MIIGRVVLSHETNEEPADKTGNGCIKDTKLTRSKHLNKAVHGNNGQEKTCKGSRVECLVNCMCLVLVCSDKE